MRYLTAEYAGLEDRNVYAKVWRDENDPPDGEHHYEEYPVGERLIGKRGRLARVIYMTNIGTIPDSFTCDVKTRAGDEWVGQLDESLPRHPRERRRLRPRRRSFRVQLPPRVEGLRRPHERPTDRPLVVLRAAPSLL